MQTRRNAYQQSIGRPEASVGQRHCGASPAQPRPRQAQRRPQRATAYRSPASADLYLQQRVAAPNPFPQHYGTRTRASSKLSFAAAVTALLLVAAVGFAGWFSLQAIQGNLPVADAASKTSPNAVKSTPKSEWTKGSVPLLFQADPEWADIRYAENSFSESGCGPTCMAMVYAALTGATDKDPAAMAAFATERGYAGPDGTAWLFMTEGAAALGLNATEVPADEQSIRQAIISGRPIICSMGPGDFTTTGHFIVITDIDQNSKLVVHDPNSAERSATSWDFNTILTQCRAMWSYSLA